MRAKSERRGFTIKVVEISKFPYEIPKCYRILLVKTRNSLHVFTRSAPQHHTVVYQSFWEFAKQIGGV